MKKLVAYLLLFAALAFAQTGLMGGSDGIHQLNTRTLGQWQVIVGTGGNFTIDPWSLTRGGVYYNDDERHKLKHYKVSSTGNFFAGLGLTDYADIGAALNINYDMSYADGYWDATGNIRQGDLDLWLKARAPFGDSSVFSLAGQFELYLPIGVRALGLRPRHAWYIHGDGETNPYTAGEVVIGLSAIWTFDFHRLNVPLRWNSNFGFVYAHEGSNTLVYGTGLDWDMFSWLTPFVEFSGEFRVQENGLPIDIMEDPMLLTPGLRLHLPWNIELAGGIDFSVRMLRNRYDREKEMKNLDAYTIGYTDEKGYYKTYGYTPTVTYAITGVLTWKFGLVEKLPERQVPAGLPTQDTVTRTDTLTMVDTLTKVDTLFKVDTVVVTKTVTMSKDADGDGVVDSVDACPGTEAGVEVDSVGCPRDFDHDGVSDMQDLCPNTPEGVPVGRDGCPLDFDADGVPDFKDQCPNTRPGIVVDSLGCDMDEDGDGVSDGRDMCPATPSNATVDTTGCPLDTDKDSVPDYLDKCPNSVRGVKVDADGCPLNKKEDLDQLKTGINFMTASTVLTKSSYGTLDDIAYLMGKFMDVNLEIQGHTDNVGDTRYNNNLSQKRAQSVVNYLIKKGVAVSRLRAVGFGASKPIADNNTANGRAQNRRVELVPFYANE